MTTVVEIDMAAVDEATVAEETADGFGYFVEQIEARLLTLDEAILIAGRIAEALAQIKATNGTIQ